MPEQESTLQTLSNAAVSIIANIFAQEQQAPTQPAAAARGPLSALPAIGGGTLLVVGAVVVFVLFFRK